MSLEHEIKQIQDVYAAGLQSGEEQFRRAMTMLDETLRQRDEARNKLHQTTAERDRAMALIEELRTGIDSLIHPPHPLLSNAEELSFIRGRVDAMLAKTREVKT